jgi:hypothetical protein
LEKAVSKDEADLITAKVQAQLDKERRELEVEYQKKVTYVMICTLPPLFLSSIVLGYRLDDLGFESQQGLGIFLFTTVGPTYPPVQWVPGFFPWE